MKAYKFEFEVNLCAFGSGSILSVVESQDGMYAQAEFRGPHISFAFWPKECS